MEKKVSYNGLNGMLSLQGCSSKGILFVPGFYGTKDESRGLFKDLASKLVQSRFSTLRYDPKGIGKSKGDIEMINLSDWRADFCSSLDYILSQDGIHDVGVVGFSLGATISILEYDKRVKAMVLMAPALMPRQDMFNRYKERGEYKKARDGEFYKNNRIVTAAMLDSLNLDLIPYLSSIKCPILIIHSASDPYIPIKTQLIYLENLNVIKGLSLYMGQDIVLEMMMIYHLE